MRPTRENYQTFYKADQKIWHGRITEEMYGPDSSIGTAALQGLLQKPDHIAQICFPSGKKYTNFEIAQWSASVAEHFKSMHLEQCDIIGLCVSNTDYLAPLFIGCMLSGFTLNILDPTLNKESIKHMYAITKPMVVFCDGNVYENVKEALQEIGLDVPIYTMQDYKDGVPTIDEFLTRNVDPNTFRAEPLKFGYNQTALFMCSSGTTGKSKAVGVSHTAVLNGSRSELQSTDILLNFSNLYWISGMWSLVVTAIAGVTRIISNRPYTPEDYFEIVKKYKPTFLFTPPRSMAMALASPKLRDYDLSSITFYLTGGCAVSPSLINKYQPYIPNAQVVVGYGCTEVGCVVARGEISSDGSIGYLASNLTMKIIDDNGQHLGPLEVGEVCIKPAYPWAGYCGNEEATKETYIDGWIHSGDVGYFNEEGRLFISDRKKDVFKCDGFQLFPTDLEERICQLPGVSEVCVCGIPDILSIHLPAAAIVRSVDSTLTEKEVYDHIAENMPHFAHLRGGVYFLDNLPRTSSGKCVRQEVQAVLEKLRNVKSSEER